MKEIRDGRKIVSVLGEKGKKNDRQDCDVDDLHRLCTYARRNHAPVYGYVRREE